MLNLEIRSINALMYVIIPKVLFWLNKWTIDTGSYINKCIYFLDKKVCLKVQCNSVSNYLELSQTPPVKGSVLCKTAPHFRHQLQVQSSPGHPYYQHAGYRFGGFHYPSGLLEQLRELRKALYSWPLNNTTLAMWVHLYTDLFQ